MCVTFSVINPQSDFGSVSLRRQDQARYAREDRGDHGVPTCREAGVIAKTNGTSGYSSFAVVAELCNGSTYDSDSYCLGSNPSSAATDRTKRPAQTAGFLSVLGAETDCTVTSQQQSICEI